MNVSFVKLKGGCVLAKEIATYPLKYRNDMQ